MSINHYSSLDLPETTLWWTHQNHPQQQQQHIQIMDPIPNPSWPNKNFFNLNNNNEELEQQLQDQEQQNNNNNEQATSSMEQEEHDDEEQQQEEEEEKEPMFEKPLTPSDVGKLNRLVIPKQHAEKYFPLSAASSSAAVTSSVAAAVTTTTASDSGECKGLLLSFEDESGKCWRFRYSYWNSSQSYVLTKGWSRYVKDKHLDAGDIVSFERHRSDSQRLFIRWRRRSESAAMAQVSRTGHGGGGGGDGSNNNGKGGGGGGGVGWTSGFYCAHPSCPTHHQQHQLAYQQQHEGLHAGKGLNQRTRAILGNYSSSSSSSSSSSKVLRLFGVNMECQTQHDDSTPQCSYNNNNIVMPSSTHGEDNTNLQNLYHFNQPTNNSYSNSHMLHQQPYHY